MNISVTFRLIEVKSCEYLDKTVDVVLVGVGK